MKTRILSSLILSIGMLVALAPTDAHAQTTAPVTLDLRDTPLRTALELLFANAKVDYAIDSHVQGYVTLKITDQPFENALRLMLRSADTPLSYTYENKVYQVRLRQEPAAPPQERLVDVSRSIPDQQAAVDQGSGKKLEKMTIMYADAADIASLFGGGVITIGSGRNQGGMGQPGVGRGNSGVGFSGTNGLNGTQGFGTQGAGSQGFGTQGFGTGMTPGNPFSPGAATYPGATGFPGVTNGRTF